MGGEKCRHAFRKRGDVSLHCKKLENEQFSYCAHQYFCHQTRRWEATPHAEDCPLRSKKSEKQEGGRT